MERYKKKAALLAQQAKQLENSALATDISAHAIKTGENHINIATGM